MKSELKEYVVTKTTSYWTCLNDKHRHRSEGDANKCIEKAAEIKAKKKLDRDKRAVLLKEFRESGGTKKAFAEKLNLSCSRVSAVLARAEREEKKMILFNKENKS